MDRSPESEVRRKKAQGTGRRAQGKNNWISAAEQRTICRNKRPSKTCAGAETQRIKDI
jgi:hypothetical protein